MKRIICLIAIICMMLFVSVQASGESEYVGRMMIVNCKENVSLRAEPTSASERLDWVPYHMVVENCYSGYGDYYYVEYYGTAGYIHKDYLEVYEGEEYFEPDGYPEMIIAKCPEWTPLREMADVNSKMIAQVPLGSVVYDCIYYWDNFTYVHYNGIGGYVLTEYVSIDTKSEQAPLLGTKYVTNCNEEVSLREEPTTQSKRLAWVPKDTIVEALAAKDGYYLVMYDGEYGYIFGDYLEEYYIEPEWYESMQVVDCFGWTSMYEYQDDELKVFQKVPLGATVTDCWKEDEYFWCCYNGTYGYIDQQFLKPIEQDSDIQLMNCRTQLKNENAAFGVYLISDSMGGEWSILQEKHHLENVLRGMGEEWQPTVMNIPDERIIEIIGGGELYLIIPADEDMTVTVNRLQLGYDGFTGIVEEELYHSEYGEPILLRCNEFEAEWDCEILFSGDEEYQVRWYPGRVPFEKWVDTGAENGICFDFTEYEMN